MSPSPVNYYDLLQISPHAEIETIERVYRILASRYGPENPQTADPERFHLLTQAYETLREPLSRARYERTLESGKAAPLPIFLAREFTDGIDAEAKIRIGVLCLLYSKRRANPDFAALSLLDMENLMAFPREKLLDHLESQLPTNQMLYKIFRASEAGVMVFPKQLASKPQ
jgi:curved DNA-binding protein